MKTKILERGIWHRTVHTFSSNDTPEDWEEFSKTLEPTKSSEESAKSILLSHRNCAKSVLLDAGFPEKECVYEIHEDGTWSELHENDARTHVGLQAVWFAVRKVEPLSIEDFALRHILNIDALLQSLERGEDTWKIVMNALTLLDTVYPLRAELSGTASSAISRIEEDRKREEGKEHNRKLKREMIDYRKSRAVHHTHLRWDENKTLRGNVDRTAKLILSEVETDVRSKFPDVDIYGIGFSARTISKDLTDLAAEYRTKTK